MLSSILLLALCAEPDGTELTLHADALLSDQKKKIHNADGHAHFTTEGVVVDADRMVYDEGQAALTAVGNVVGRVTQGGLMAVLGDVVTLRLDDQQEVKEIYLLEGHAIAKKDTTPAALLAADTREKLKSVGHTQALLDGNHLSRDGKKWTADKISLVPCDCNLDHPSWSIEARGATIDTEAERVSLLMPVVEVHNVPVLWFPWLSLPLNGRQSGILFTKPMYSPLNGFSIEQPVYLTLGRSADLTLNPGYFFGAPNQSPGLSQQQPFGISGPRLQAEFRYTPSARASGRLFVGALYDSKYVRDPYNPSQLDLLPDYHAPLLGSAWLGDRRRGLRGELAWSHTQDLDLGFGARAEVSAYSDGYYNKDVTTDVLQAVTGYLRSSASFFQRGDDHLIGLEAVLRQDLTNGYNWFGRAAHITGSSSPSFGPGTMGRWPALTASVPFKPLAGPLAFDFTGEFVRVAPLFSKSGDEGVGAREGDSLDASGSELHWECLNAHLNGNAPSSQDSKCPIETDGPNSLHKPGQGDRLWSPGEREARDRFMLFPRIHVAGSAFDVVGLSAWAGWRESVWLGEASGRTWQRGTLVVDARAETELSRSFGGLRHTIQPLVAVRAIPLVTRGSSDANSAEVVPYDEVDGAVPRGGGARAQLAVEVRQRLAAPGGLTLRLDLGQGVDLVAPERSRATLGETYGRFAVSEKWFSGQLQARVDPIQNRLTRLTAGCGVDDGRGHGVNASYENLLDDGTNRTRTPIDLLFGAPVPSYFTSRAQQVSTSAYWNFGPIGARYSILFGNAAWDVSPTNPAPPPVFSFSQHQLTLSLTPACDCWRVDVYGMQHLVATSTTQPPLSIPEFGATVTVSNFGSIGTR